jgi:hypothetical protein
MAMLSLAYFPYPSVYPPSPLAPSSSSVPYPDILGSICHIHHIYISNTSLYWKESGWGGEGGGEGRSIYLAVGKTRRKIAQKIYKDKWL